MFIPNYVPKTIDLVIADKEIQKYEEFLLTDFEKAGKRLGIPIKVRFIPEAELGQLAENPSQSLNQQFTKDSIVVIHGDRMEYYTGIDTTLELSRHADARFLASYDTQDASSVLLRIEKDGFQLGLDPKQQLGFLTSTDRAWIPTPLLKEGGFQKYLEQMKVIRATMPFEPDYAPQEVKVVFLYDDWGLFNLDRHYKESIEKSSGLKVSFQFLEENLLERLARRPETGGQYFDKDTVAFVHGRFGNKDGADWGTVPRNLLRILQYTNARFIVEIDWSRFEPEGIIRNLETFKETDPREQLSYFDQSDINRHPLECMLPTKVLDYFARLAKHEKDNAPGGV